MRSNSFALCVVGAGLLLAGPASAQEIVHALSGTVSGVDPQAKTINVQTNDGSEGAFSFSTPGSGMEVSFDRDLKAQTVPVSSLNKGTDQVVVFYYGNSSLRKAVAVRDLGPGPFHIVEGSVTHFERHGHTLTVQTDAGKKQTFVLDPKAVADTSNGAIPGSRFDPAKGDHVRVIASGAGAAGTAGTALFVRD